jgi:hypothetical protein
MNAMAAAVIRQPYKHEYSDFCPEKSEKIRCYQKKAYLCRRQAVPQGSIGNRVEIPDSSRCCKLFNMATTPLKTNTFREGGQFKGVSQKTCRLSLKRSFRDKSWFSLIYNKVYRPYP